MEKTKVVALRIDAETYKKLKQYKIDVSALCRKAIKYEIIDEEYRRKANRKVTHVR